MKTEWFCPNCKTVMTFDTNVAEQDFKCTHCGYRYLVPIKKEE